MALVRPDHMTGRSDQTMQRDRYLFEHLVRQQGVVSDPIATTPLLVSQRAAGASRAVDVAPGAAWVRGTDEARWGAFHLYNDGVFTTPDFSPNTSGQPRVDGLALKVNTTKWNTSDEPAFVALEGVPTAGAQVTNRVGASYRAGALSVPTSALLLAEWVSANGYTQILSSQIVDRRTWAHGQKWSATQVIAVAMPAAFAPPSAAFAPRLECSGAELLVNFGFTFTTPAAGSRTVELQLLDDGTDIGHRRLTLPANSNGSLSLNIPYTPVAGSHVFSFRWQDGVGDTTAWGSGGYTVGASIREG